MKRLKGKRSGSSLTMLGAVVVCASLSTLACGGGAVARAPVSPVEPAPAANGTPAVTEGGQQFAMPDAPTSSDGAAAAANRPKMNASALSAYNAGIDAFKVGDLAGAKAQFTQATQADPKAYQGFYSLGVVLERLGDTAGALSAYRQSTAVVADYEPAIVAYAVLLARSGKPDDAVDFLNQRQAQMSKSAAVTAALAEVKSIQGNSGEAQRLAQDALKLNPDYRPAMVTLARDHYRARRLDLALYALKGILDGYGEENPPRDKNNAEAHLLRGLIYKEQGSRALAIQELQKALELRPDLVEARVQLASYFLESGNAADVQKLLEPALKYDSQNVVAHLNLGDAYRLLGRAADSKREFEWVKTHDPSLAQVHYDLGLLYLFTDNFPGLTPTQAADNAIDELTQYKKMKPRVAGGAPDDTEELITRAKTKKALIAANAEPPAAAAPASGAAAPAGGAAAPAGGAAAGSTKAPPSAQFAPAPAGGAQK